MDQLNIENATKGYWTFDDVKECLVGAFEILKHVPMRGGGSTGNGWPSTLIEFSDLIEQVGTESAENEPKIKLRPTAEQITKMEEVLLWQARYLKQAPGSARMLALWLACQTTSLKFSELLSRRRLVRSSAYRQRDRAIRYIAEGLQADKVKVFDLGRLSD